MNQYSVKYEELEIVGRGNYGCAYLVNDKKEGKLYISKKIQLKQLSQKEIEQSIQEVDLLKRLKHPNIVEYIDSFIDQDILLIIMEYCEEGDMQFHIKRKQQKKEFFQEELILNWFLQMTMALQYLHSQKVLHRDIKTSNIFITSNGTIKVGDFGISKVLEDTISTAQTVVGTPYYMSPEVCENKPYTFKSDVWALGCVLHELCTLQYVFQANNLLSLVYKIVKDQPPRIPPQYSSQLQEILDQIMQKDYHKRPNIIQILQNPYTQKAMKIFIESNGKLQTNTSIPIKQTQTHKQLKKLNSNYNSIQTNNQHSQQIICQDQLETPNQKMIKRKQMINQAKEEQLKQAIQQNISQKGIAKQMKMQNLFGQNYNQSMQKQSQYQQTIQSNMENTDIQEKTVESILIGNSQLNNNIQQHLENTQNSLDDKTIMSMNYSKTYHQNLQLLQQQQQQQQTQNYDLSNKYQFQLTNMFQDMTLKNQQINNNENDYEDDFEEYNSSEEDEEGRLTNKAGQQELNQVVDIYKQLLHSTHHLCIQFIN